MTQDKKALTLGSADFYINRVRCGQMSGVTLERTVEVQRHETNTNLEFAVDHVVPLMTSMRVSGRFGEISPKAVNLLLSSGLGFSKPQASYNIAGRLPFGSSTPEMSAEPLEYDEYVTFVRDTDGNAVWQDLLYQPAPVNAGASGPPTDFSIVNTTGGAGVPTYYAYFLTCKSNDRLATGATGTYYTGTTKLESIPSNIVIQPSWAAPDQ